MFGGERHPGRAQHLVGAKPGRVGQLLDRDTEQPGELLNRRCVWSQRAARGKPLDRPLVDAGKAPDLCIGPTEAALSVDPVERRLRRNQRHWSRACRGRQSDEVEAWILFAYLPVTMVCTCNLLRRYL